MGSEAIPGKTSLPMLPAVYLPRQRLDALWQHWERCLVVTLEAGAGYGKTTLLAANARRSPRRLLWYTFDALDVDLAGFCRNLGAALRSDGASLDGSGEGDGTNEDADLSDGSLSRRILAELLRHLQSDDKGWNLVFDDLHAVRDVPSILGFLDHLARLLPGGNTLFLASREPVGVRTGKLRAQGLGIAVTTRELQFTREEASALCRQALPGLSVGPQDLERVAAKTEGWAAGLGICLRFLEATPGASWKLALGHLASAGPDWFSYFAEEVLGALDRPDQDFLMRASLLPRLEPALCDAVLGVADSASILESLHRRNLFTFPVSEKRDSYRFHQLFQEFLRRQLARRVPAGEVARLRRRAAARLAAAGSWMDAAEASLEAGEPDRARRLLERHGQELLDTGQHGRLLRALEALPAAGVSAHPAALFLLGRAHEVQGRWDEAVAFYGRALRRRPPTALRVSLISTLAQIHNRRGRHAECTRLCRAALAMRGWRDRGAWARLQGLLGTSAAELGRYDEAERHLRGSAGALAKAGDISGEGRLRYLLAINVHGSRGEFRAAREAARRALVLFQRAQDPRRVCHSLGVLAFVTVLAGEEREARELAEETLRQSVALGHRGMEAFTRVTLGRCALLRADLEAAETHFAAAREMGATLGETDLETYPHLGLAEVALARGNRHAARAAAREALEFARRTKDPLQQAQASTLLALACSAREAARARAWWNRSERTLRAIGAGYELHRTLMARLHAGEVPARKRRAVLEELLLGTAGMRHENLFLATERARAPRVLGMALELDVERKFAASLMVRLGADAVPELARLGALPGIGELCVRLLGEVGGEAALAALASLRDPATRAGRVAQRAWEELGRSPESPLHVRALGRLEVALGGVPVVAWGSARARRLFLALLLRRFRWVAADELVEALWPGVDADRGRNNLVQSVYLLRRALQPDLAQAKLSRHVLSARDACRLEPGQGAHYDVLGFEAALERAQAAGRAGRRDATESALREAVELYRGDFVEELPCEELVAEERERLRERMLGALSHLLELLAAARRWPEMPPLCRLGLAKDPYREDFHAHLVEVHLAAGNRHEALARCHEFEKLLRKDLGLAPSARMRALEAKAAGG